MSTNQQLKQARKLVSQNKLEDALEIADSLIEDEPENINALLVKGVCLQRQKEHDKCTAVLQRITELDPSNFLAWKGLARSYFVTNKVAEYFGASLEVLLQLSKKPKELTQKQIEDDARDTFSKMRSCIHSMTKKPQNSKLTAASADTTFIERLLEVQIVPLPSTKPEIREVHDFLESLSPPVLDPQALPELIYRRQQSLSQNLGAITARSKQTLGYTGKKVVKDRIEAISTSNLTDLMRVQIDTEDDDEIRRNTESEMLELLVMKLEFMVEGGSTVKDEAHKQLLSDIRDLSDRMAMFEPVKPLAWELAWDWTMPSLEASDYKIRNDAEESKKGSSKREKSKLKKMNKSKNGRKDSKKEEDAKMPASNDDSNGSNNVQGTEREEEGEEEEAEEEDLGEQVAPTRRSKENESRPLPVEVAVQKYSKAFSGTPLGQVISAFLSSQTSFEKLRKHYNAYKGSSVFGWLLCARFFISRKSYESAIDSVHHGLIAAKKRKQVFDMQMDDAILHFKMILAAAYTHFQAPKNFGLASDLYDEVLSAQPDNIEAKVGKGLVLSQQGEQDKAIDLLEQVVSQSSDNELALAELSWLFVQRGEIDRGIDGLKQCITLQNTPLRNAELNFKIGYALWSKGDRESSFESFVAALECSQNYAPAFTYLGLFFEQVSKDQQRAQRCFYRALELDNGELIAGERLASDFANHSQWDLVEVVASTVLTSSKLKGARGVDWPYRAMGIVCLNQLRYEDAVKYFQRCLRSQSSDIQAWIGLGEAYIHSGRYRSAEKALLRALKLEPTNFSALYVLSLAQREMLNFPASAESLQLAISHAPESSVALQWALADNSMNAADYFVGQSMLGHAVIEIEHALRAIVASVEHESTGIFLGSAAQVILQLVDMGYKNATNDEGSRDEEKALPSVIASCIQELGEKTHISHNGSLLDAAEDAALRYVELSVKESKPRRVSAHAIAAQVLDKNGKIEESIKHFQAGISLEARNEDLWNAYGIVVQKKNQKVAQHCFVRALSLNGRSADTWVNLAGLYLTSKDAELALEAVDRALSLEPEHPRAWIAQALAETMLNSKSNENLYRTFEYAYLLSNNDQLANFALALKEYELRPAEPSSACLGAMTKLLQVKPSHNEANLIMGLLLERQGDFESSLVHLSKVNALPHMARVQLALHRYSDALENCKLVESGPEFSVNEKLSCLLTSGLAQYFLSEFDGAIESFTEALSVASAEGKDDSKEEDVLRLLVEVLYASNNADARQVAQDQLFASIEEHGPTLQVTMLLGAIGILEQDDVVKEAAKQELEALITPDLQGEALAQTCHILALIDPADRSFQRAVFQWPTEYSLWRRVSKEQALLIAEGQLTNPEQLSQALVEAGGLDNSQRAVFLDPTSDSAWESLAGQVQSELHA